MGKTQSKTDIVIPVNSVHDGNTDFVSHHINAGTLKTAIGAFLIIIILLALMYMLCKKFLAHHRFGGQVIPEQTLVRYVEKPREVLPKLS